MPDPHSETEPISPGALSEHSSQYNEPQSPTSSKAPSPKKGKKQREEPRDTGPKFEGEYTGGLVDGIRHGKGSVKFPNGDTYHGDFRNGMRDGTGVYLRHVDGVRYSGGWFRSFKHGTGKETWPNGDLYEGDFKMGLFHGKGAQKSRSGWYRGDFEEGLKHGHGTMNFNSGASYEGGWCANRFHGEGTYTWPDNRRYEGDWLEGRHSGLGIMLWPNGQKHDGGWLHGEMHGPGMHRWQNGTCREGVWHKGERTEWTGSENFGLVGPCAKAKVAAAKAKEKARAEAKRLTMGGIAVAGGNKGIKKKPGGGRSVSPTKKEK